MSQPYERHDRIDIDIAERSAQLGFDRLPDKRVAVARLCVADRGEIPDHPHRISAGTAPRR